MSGTTVRLFQPGLIDYDDALSWQNETAAALREGRGPESLALLEHPPVFTLGRRTRPQHLLVDPAELRRRGAEVVAADRGGDITFHGPGQLVGYPILDLRARGVLPGDYVRLLEQTLIDALAAFGVRGERIPGRPGVWAAGRKIAAIGVRVSGGVTTHGFALNVSTDLSWFDAIVPCGLTGAGVTSMLVIQGVAPPFEQVEAVVARAFCAALDIERLEADIGPASPDASSATTEWTPTVRMAALGR